MLLRTPHKNLGEGKYEQILSLVDGGHPHERRVHTRAHFHFDSILLLEVTHMLAETQKEA